MKKRSVLMAIVIASVILIIFVVISILSRTNDMLPNWLPEDLADEAPVKWTADLSSDGEIVYVIAQSSKNQWSWEKSSNMVKRTEATYHSAENSLTFSNLHALSDTLSLWMKKEQNEMIAEAVSFAYAQPDSFFSRYSNAISSAENRVLIYSLSQDKITEKGNIPYDGNRTYGAVSIYSHSGLWQVLIDD